MKKWLGENTHVKVGIGWSKKKHIINLLSVEGKTEGETGEERKKTECRGKQFEISSFKE